jgi:hypothetical protein
LPSSALAYVLAFLDKERRSFVAEFASSPNLGSYRFLTSLIQNELSSRGPDWMPVMQNCNASSDGLLATPLAGSPPFGTPASVTAEADRIAESLDSAVASRMLTEMAGRVRRLSPPKEWISVSAKLEDLLLALPQDEGAAG